MVGISLLRERLPEVWLKAACPGQRGPAASSTVGCFCLSFSKYDMMLYQISGLNSKPTEIQTAKKPHHFFCAALVRENQLDRDQLSTCAPLLQQLGAINPSIFVKIRTIQSTEIYCSACWWFRNPAAVDIANIPVFVFIRVSYIYIYTYIYISQLVQDF